MLISQKEFLLTEIPLYHPATDAYVTWWKEQYKRCIEGYWQSGYWMPPKLYFYSNFSTIKLKKNKYDKSQTYARPSLRDIEWKVFRDFTIAKGFSGFELDQEFSCIRDLIDPKIEDWELPPSAFKPDGSRKTYVPALEYIAKQHPTNMGRPEYYNEAKNYALMGPRGWGKSMMASGIITHEFLTDSTLYMDAPQSVSNIIVGAGHTNYSKGLLTKVKDMMELLPGSQKIGDLVYPCPFFRQHTGSWQPSKQVIQEYSKKIGGKWEVMGTKSWIKHVSYAENEFAGQGERNNLMVYEEMGMFMNLLDCHRAAVENMKLEGIKFGVGFYLGTGGAMESGGTFGAMEIFCNPENYDVLCFQDEYESRGSIGRFIPAYLNRSEFRNEDGITDVEKAKTRLEQERKEEEKKLDSISYTKYIINNAVLPSEMFLMETGTLLPAVEATQRLQTLEKDNSHALIEKTVELYFDRDNQLYNGVSYKIDTTNSLTPINNFPWKDKNREGAVVIYEFPQIVGDKVPANAYIIGHDPYKDDSATGNSLATIYVMKTSAYFDEIGHNEIVASYIGRPYAGRNRVNEILLQLSLMYGNAKIYFESAVGNTKDYFEKIKRLDLLCHKPSEVFSTSASYQGNPSVEYGYPMSNQFVKAKGVSYYRDWLLEEREVYNEKPIRNIDKLYCKVLLKQTALFNYDGNFDSVMAAIGCCIGLASINRTFKNQQYKDIREQERINYDIITKNKKLFNNVPDFVSFAAPIVWREEG